MPPPQINTGENDLVNIVPAPPASDAVQNGSADQVAPVVARLVRDLESLGRHFLPSADTSGELALDVREMIMRSMFAPHPRKAWLASLLPPGTNPLKAQEGMDAFQNIMNLARTKNPPALMRVEEKNINDAKVRFLKGWENSFYRVCLGSLEVLRSMDMLDSSLFIDDTFSVLNGLPTLGIQANEVHEAFGLKMSVVRTLPQIRFHVSEGVAKYIYKFESGQASDMQVLIGGTFFELLARFRVEEPGSPIGIAQRGSVIAGASSRMHGIRLKNTRQQILSMSVPKVLEFLKEAADGVGAKELAHILGLEEDGIVSMAEDLRKAQRLLRILISGHAGAEDDEEENVAAASSSSSSSSSGSSDGLSPAERQLKWKEQVRIRLKRQVRDKKRKRKEADSLSCTKTSFHSTTSSKSPKSSDVVYVVGPNGRWIKADVISIKPGADQASCRVMVSPRDGLSKGKRDQVLMYSEASVHTKLPSSGRSQYTRDLDDSIRAKFQESQDANQSMSETHAEDAKKAEEQMANPSAMTAIMASLTVGKTLKFLVAWVEIIESRQLKHEEQIKKQEMIYWHYIKETDRELRDKLRSMQKKERMKWAWDLDPEGRGSENRFVALAHVLGPKVGKPKYSPPHANPELELQLAAKRLLLSKFALGQWGSIALFFWLFIVGIIFLTLGIPLMLIGVLMVLGAPACLLPAVKAHRQIRLLLKNVPATALARRVVERKIEGRSKPADGDLKPVPREAWANEAAPAR